MKCTFIITITLACLCTYINGQIQPFGTTLPPMNGAGGFGGGAGGFGAGGGRNDYGFGTGLTTGPQPTFNPKGSIGDDSSMEDSTTMYPGEGNDGANAQQSISGGGQFALGFVAVLLVVGAAVVLLFLVRRKRAQEALREQTTATSA